MKPETTKKVLEEVKDDLDRLETEIAKLREVKAFLVKKLALPDSNGAVEKSPIEAEPTKLSQQYTQKEAAKKVLLEAGKPLPTNKIVELMVRRDYYPDAADRKQLVNSIFSVMRRNPEIFRKAGRGVWGLTGEDRVEL